MIFAGVQLANVLLVVLGNAITYPAGGKVGDNCLVGTKTLVPLENGPVRDNVGLLGSPPFEIPRSTPRQQA
jgi:hypothetical protein